MRKRDDAFEAFRASNPVDESTVPAPDSPQARALFDEITATPRTQEVALARFPRRRLVVAIAVALLALASIAAAWLILRDVTDPIAVVCYQAPSLDSDAADATTEGTLGVELCEPAWKSGRLVNEDIVPSGEVPPLVGCVTDQGNLAVFPSDSQALCTQLGLAEPNPESVPDSDVLRELQNELVQHFDQQVCQPIEDASQDVRRILDTHGFEDWQIQVAPGGAGRPCASLAFDVANETVHLVPIPDLSSGARP
ncbi:MAG: hypothetical protein R2823_10795 [Acidimicrobiia bacterium]